MHSLRVINPRTRPLVGVCSGSRPHPRHSRALPVPLRAWRGVPCAAWPHEVPHKLPHGHQPLRPLQRRKGTRCDCHAVTVMMCLPYAVPVMLGLS